MIEKETPRNSYCDLWEKSPETIRRQNIPPGYGGICNCGAPGHWRHYPGPVPVTAAWCDICYEIEKHKGPNRKVGAWYLNTSTGEEQNLDRETPQYLERLHDLLISLKTERSALVIELPGEIGIDFFVQTEGTLLCEYANQKADSFARGEVGQRVARVALETVISGGDFQEEMENAGVKLEYYIDQVE